MTEFKAYGCRLKSMEDAEAVWSAESAGKARYYHYLQIKDAGAWTASLIDIRVRRLPQFDGPVQFAGPSRPWAALRLRQLADLLDRNRLDRTGA